jgi:hypothetical protein
MAKMSGISVSSVQRIWRKHGLQPHPTRSFGPNRARFRRRTFRFRSYASASGMTIAVCGRCWRRIATIASSSKR